MMAVECPINKVDLFGKLQGVKLCCEAYFKPLHVDCSVEYELPNSAKPPMGNKNEPLLMIHPSYYRREESKRRSHFVNNLPKRRTNNKYARSIVERDVENKSNYGSSNYLPTKQKTNDASSLSKILVPSEIFHTETDFDNTCFQVRTKVPRNKVLDSLRPRTIVQTSSKAHQVDLASLWKGTVIETYPSTSFDLMLPASERTHVPKPIPVPESVSTQIYDPWIPNYQSVKAFNNKRENNKYISRNQDGSKNTFKNSNHTPDLKKAPIYDGRCDTISNSTAVTNNLSLSTYHQRQPAVGVAAIAATSSNCRNPPSLYPASEGNRHPLMHQQPWSATTAPDFPPSSLPLSHTAPNRSMIGIICPDVPPQFSSARKRTSDVSWPCDEYVNNNNLDSSGTKRNRMSVNENVQTCHSRSYVTNEPELCKVYQMDESRNYYNHSITGNSGITSCNNLNSLQLFRL